MCYDLQVSVVQTVIYLSTIETKTLPCACAHSTMLEKDQSVSDNR